MTWGTRGFQAVRFVTEMLSEELSVIRQSPHPKSSSLRQVGDVEPQRGGNSIEHQDDFLTFPQLGLLFQRCNCLDRIEPEYVGKLQKFNNVDAPLSTFKPSHKGLIFAESHCEVSLRQARLSPLLNEQFDQGSMTPRS